MDAHPGEPDPRRTDEELPGQEHGHAGRDVVPRDDGAIHVRGVVADEHRHGIGLGKRAGPRPGARDTAPPTTRNARMSRSSIAPLVAACRPARVRAGEPSCKDTYRRERPPRRRGGGLTRCLTPWLTPPLRRAAPAAQKGGSLPSRPSPLARFGSAGLRTKSRTTTATNGRGGCDTPPAVFGTPPPVSVSDFARPRPALRVDPGTVQRTGHHQIATSGVVNRTVGQIVKRSIAPRAVALVGVPSGRCCNHSRRSAAFSHPPAARNNSRLPMPIAV